MDIYFIDICQVMDQILHDVSLSSLRWLDAYIDTVNSRMQRDDMRNGCRLGNFTAKATDHSKSIRLRLVEVFGKVQESVAYCLLAAEAIVASDKSDLVAPARWLLFGGRRAVW